MHLARNEKLLDTLSPIGDNSKVKPVDFHKKAREVVREFSKPIRRELGEALLKLQQGMHLLLPLSRPMPSIHSGAHELRLRDEAGIYRAFYYTKSERGVLVFHAFVKKTQETPDSEIALGRKRLREMLSHEKNT